MAAGNSRLGRKTLLGFRGARMNDMLAVLKLLGERRIRASRRAFRCTGSVKRTRSWKRRPTWSAGSSCCRGPSRGAETVQPSQTPDSCTAATSALI